MNLVLFLGAGFSAPFGHPVMDSFLGFADSCKRLTADDRTFLGRLVLEARRANSFLESSPTNLEDILSFSEMGDRLGLTSTDEQRNHRLREIVQRVYTNVPSPKDYWSRYQALKSLIGTDLHEFKGELSFITTNYDLNIESACYSLRASVNPGFALHRVDAGRVQVVGQSYHEKGLPLYKLHGSVNWFPCDEEPGVRVEDRVVAVQGSWDDNQPRSLPYSCAGDYESPDAPLIVPPSFLKPDLPSALKSVWRGAAHALSRANVVAFVGYSFPTSDTDMMYFLARALSENSGLRAVYVIDPKADSITSRLRSPGSKMGSHFRDLLRPMVSDWGKVVLPL